MSFRSIVRDVRDSIGSLSRRSFDFKLSIHHREGGGGKSRGSVQDCHEEQQQQLQQPLALLVQETPWANLPPELLRDVIKRLEESESAWPARKHVVACASVCKSWRDMCKEIVQRPELSGKITFPVSLKQPGPRDATMQCFIKRDKSNLTYHLYLCLSPALLVENGKFLLSAKRIRRTTYTEYVISMHADTISRSSNTYIGKIRSNFIGTKFIIYDTQPPYNNNNNKASKAVQPLGLSRRFHSKRVSPKVPTCSYKIAQVSYELNVLGTRGPRRMHCAMDSIPASSLAEGGTVPGQPETIVPRSLLDESFRSITSSSSRKFISDYSTEFNSARFSDILGPLGEEGEAVFEEGEKRVSSPPLVLKNKPPRWHEQLQCWCLNFRGRVTVASVKNFQLIAANPPQPQAQAQAQAQSDGPEKILLQFGKVGKDMFTMDFRYPLSAFQAFAICLSSFDTKLACE